MDITKKQKQLIKLWYKDFRITKKNKNLIKDHELYQLYKQQKEPKSAQGKFFTPKPGYKLQADLLFLPPDQGYKYLLVVIDISDKKIDFEPLKSKKVNEIIISFDKIFNRHIIIKPKLYISTDPGKEFDNNQFKKYLKKQDIYLKINKPGRHRQNSLVERANRTIGTMIYKYISSQKLASNEQETGWIHKLKLLRKILNFGKKAPSKLEINKNKNSDIKLTKLNSIILPENTKVRIKLDLPTDIINGKRLTGNKRASDINFSKKIYTITSFELLPNQPPFYYVNNDKTTRYTREQLLPISASHKPPIKSVRVIENNKTIKKYIVDKILDKKKEKGRIYYLVKYKGYKEPSWNSRINLIKDIPEIIKQFDKK